MIKIAIGSDHRGYALKAKIKAHLLSKSYDVVDVGTHSSVSCDYPLFAKEVASRVSRKDVELGVLICGSGIGMSIVANKYKGVRAALVHDKNEAKLSREHNHANILVLGEQMDTKDILPLLDTWLATPVSYNSRHMKRIQLLEEIEGELYGNKSKLASE